MAAFIGTTYHADSDADDEFEERSVMTSPIIHDDDSDGTEPFSGDGDTPTFEPATEDSGLPRTIITEWSAEETARFVASLGLRQYSERLIDDQIVGEALVALNHAELKELGILSVGHRVTILKAVYDIKVQQDINMDPEDYCPMSAGQGEMASKDDIHRLAKAILKLRDERILELEAQLLNLDSQYRRLRQEMLPLFKNLKETEHLPTLPTATPVIPENMAPTQNIINSGVGGLARTFSKKLFLGSRTSPTIPEGRTLADSSALESSAAATVASNSLTASLSGGSLPGNSPSMPSPTSPYPYSAHQSLAPTSYRRDGSAVGISRYDGADDGIPRSNATPTPPTDPPNSGKSTSSRTKYESTLSSASTAVGGNSTHNSMMPQPLSSSSTPAATPGSEAPSVEIFKSFRVGLEDPCWKVLPAALRKYNIQADWRQYALYIVYGDQERAVGLEEKPLTLFKDLDREGKKPMFMLRKQNGGDVGISSSAAGVRPLASGATISSAASVRTMQPGGTSLPGGVL